MVLREIAKGATLDDVRKRTGGAYKIANDFTLF